MIQRVVIALSVLMVLFFIVVVTGNRHLNRQVDEDRGHVHASASDPPPILMPGDAIPSPLRRYLNWAVLDTLRPIYTASLSHGAYYGLIERRDDAYETRWKYIVAERFVAPHREAFVWRGLMHLRWDFWTKCRYHLIGNRVMRTWKWMGILSHSYPSEAAVRRNALLEHLATAMWIPTQIISEPHQQIIALDDTTLQITHRTPDDTVQAQLIIDMEGRPMWLTTTDYHFRKERGFEAVSRRVKYWRYETMKHYRMPSRMSATLLLNGVWVDQSDFRLDEWTFSYGAGEAQESWMRQ